MTCSFPRTGSPDILRTRSESPLARPPAPSVATANPACGHSSGQKNIYRGQIQQQFLATGKFGSERAGNTAFLRRGILVAYFGRRPRVSAALGSVTHRSILAEGHIPPRGGEANVNMACGQKVWGWDLFPGALPQATVKMADGQRVKRKFGGGGLQSSSRVQLPLAAPWLTTTWANHWACSGVFT